MCIHNRAYVLCLCVFPCVRLYKVSMNSQAKVLTVAKTLTVNRTSRVFWNVTLNSTHKPMYKLTPDNC